MGTTTGMCVRCCVRKPTATEELSIMVHRMSSVSFFFALCRPALLLFQPTLKELPVLGWLDHPLCFACPCFFSLLPTHHHRGVSGLPSLSSSVQ